MAEILDFELGKKKQKEKENSKSMDIFLGGDCLEMAPPPEGLSSEQKKLRRKKIEELVKPKKRSGRIHIQEVDLDNPDEVIGFMKALSQSDSKEIPHSQLSGIATSQPFIKFNWFESPAQAFPCFIHAKKSDNTSLFLMVINEDELPNMEYEWLPAFTNLKNRFQIIGLQFKTLKLAEYIISHTADYSDYTLDTVAEQRNVCADYLSRRGLDIKYQCDKAYVGFPIREMISEKDIPIQLSTFAQEMGVKIQVFGGIEI